jgi:hypothetical protein
MGLDFVRLVLPPQRQPVNFARRAPQGNGLKERSALSAQYRETERGGIA